MGICLIVKSGGGIDTSSATATADKILSGYTIYSNDNKITGSMRNVGNQANTDLNDPNGYHWLTPGTVIQSWGGWHDGTCQLIAQSLESQTQCDIPNQWWCLTGYSYWANGSKYDGAMVNRGTKTWSIGANGSQTIEDGWHNGSGTVKQSINVDNGEWGPTPTTTNQQLCWQGWYYSKNRWCWGNSNLVAGNIKKGVSIFGVSGNYVEPRRYIIQNGALCSGVSIPYHCWDEDQDGEDGDSFWRLESAALSYYNVTINGLNYIRLYSYDDHGSWDESEKTIIRGGIGSIVSLSSNDANGRLPGAICGDFACQYISSPSFSMETVLHPGSSSRDRMKAVTWYLTPQCAKNSSGSWVTFSYVQTGVSTRISGSFGRFTWAASLKYGDFMFSPGSGYAPRLACRNLWIDTSRSI